jgi:DNA repair protein RadC
MINAYEIRIVPVDGVHEVSPDKLSKPEHVLPLLETIRYQDVENFVCITLNGAGQPINTRIVTIGLLNHSLVHPRETFRGAIMDNAAAIIIAHNHPSGSIEPSSQDIAITGQLKAAGDIIGIAVLDHIIVTKDRHISMRERGLI